MATPLRVASGSAHYMKSLPKSRRQYGTAPMPDFIEPQLAKLVSEPPRGSEWVFEIKLDGYRIQARVKNGQCVLRSRSGLDYTSKFPEIAEACADLSDCIIDGEVCAVNKDGMPSFSGLQNAMSKGNTSKLVYFVFDLLWLNWEDKRPYDLGTRKKLLQPLIEALPDRVRYLEHMATSGAQMFAGACKMKLEGIVAKDTSKSYRSDRSGSWQKIKCRPRQEAIIGGWEMNGARLARIMLGAYRGGKLTYIGGAGTGFNEKNAPGILKQLRAMEIPKMAFEINRPSKAREKHYCRPELVCEVEFEDWTASGKMRQASFKALRVDKDPSEVVVEVADDE
jgi:bifunctional non-homologous end joining protein LigD